MRGESRDRVEAVRAMDRVEIDREQFQFAIEMAIRHATELEVGRQLGVTVDFSSAKFSVPVLNISELNIEGKPIVWAEVMRHR